MRILAISGLILGFWTLAAAAGAQAANDGPWCYRDFGKTQPNCGFATARQCLSIAGIAGGICERNHYSANVPEVPKKRRARPS